MCVAENNKYKKIIRRNYLLIFFTLNSLYSRVYEEFVEAF